MTPDEPESPGAPDAAEDSAKSRADLQAELRSTRKKERKRQHRWRRRGISALSFIIVLAALGVGGHLLLRQLPLQPDQEGPRQASRRRPRHPGEAVQPPSGGIGLPCVRLELDAGERLRQRGQRRRATQRRDDGGAFDPAAKTVTVLSIPRDLWVDIPGNSAVSGMNRINAAFDSGPDLLVQTIEQDLGIPINHYMSVNFPGFSGMVNALGGVTMDFPTPVKDQYTGLNVSTVGCQVVNGTTALELVAAGTSITRTPTGTGSTTAFRTSAVFSARTPSSAPC